MLQLENLKHMATILLVKKHHYVTSAGKVFELVINVSTNSLKVSLFFRKFKRNELGIPTLEYLINAQYGINTQGRKILKNE